MNENRIGIEENYNVICKRGIKILDESKFQRVGFDWHNN